MSGTTEKAILAGGCFWGMQDLIRKRPGVLSTRVGYTGGEVANATYRNHGIHAEAIEITFDPDADLLPRPARVLLPGPRPDDAEPSGQRRRCQLPLGHLLPGRRAATGRRGHHRRCRGLRTVAGPRRHRGHAGGAVLGGRARAPGLPRALPQRVHLPLPTARAGSCPIGATPSPERTVAPFGARLKPAGADGRRGGALRGPEVAVAAWDRLNPAGSTWMMASDRFGM